MNQGQFLAVMVSISRNRRLSVSVAVNAENKINEGLLLARLQSWSRKEMEDFVVKVINQDDHEKLLGALFSQLSDELSEKETLEV